jgi:hypothetical protein
MVNELLVTMNAVNSRRRKECSYHVQDIGVAVGRVVETGGVNENDFASIDIEQLGRLDIIRAGMQSSPDA